MKVEVAVMGSPFLIVRIVSVDVKQPSTPTQSSGAQCRGSRSARLPVPNSLTVRTVSVDVSSSSSSSSFLFNIKYIYWSNLRFKKILSTC